MGLRDYKPGQTKLVEVDLQAEAEKWREKQQEDLSRDFDAVIQAEKAKARKFRLDGQTFTIPRKLPVWVQTFILTRMDDDGNVSHKDNLELIERLIGADFVEKLKDPQISNFLPVEKVNQEIIFPLIRDAGLDFDAGDSGNPPKTPAS